MNLRQAAWAFLVLCVFTVAEVVALRTQTTYGYNVSFVVSGGDNVSVYGPEFVSASTEAASYHRIDAGQSHLIGLEVENGRFSSSDPAFPTGNWRIEQGMRIKTTLSSDSLIVVVKEVAPYTRMIVIVLGLFSSIFIWSIGHPYLH